MPGGMQCAIGSLPCPPAAGAARLAWNMAWYSGVSGGSWRRPAPRSGSKVPAVVRSQRPFQSGYFDASCAWAPTPMHQAATNAIAAGNFRQAMMVLVTALDSFHHGLHLIASSHVVIDAEPIENPEALERPVADSRAARQLFDRVALGDRHQFEAQRLCGIAFLEAHATEARHRFAEGAIGLRRHAFGREDEAVHVAAETDSVKPECPLIGFCGRRRGHGAADAHILYGLLVDAVDPARGQVFRQRLLGGHAHD